MRTPEKGDVDSSVPFSQAARQAAMNWDPAKDEAAGEQCRAYGAAAIMRVPGRLHITWENENTLRIDTDAGTQTRMLRFGGQQPPAGAPPEWQGFSVATWEGMGGRGGGRGGGGGGAPLTAAAGGAPAAAPVRPGSVKVVTTNMRPGYIRKNGFPYGNTATMTEYFDRVNEPNGDVLLIVSTTLEDPQYLTQPFLTSTHFKKEPDASKWSPSVCSAR